MKIIISYVITFCLISIVVLMLLRNKGQIDAQIAFAEQKVEAYPVKVQEVKTGNLDKKLEIPGLISASNELMLIAETQGRVLKIYNNEGEWVNEGELIAQVDDQLMKAELIVTSANYEKAQKDLQRALTLNEGGAITQQQLEGLQLNEKAAHAKYITSSKRVADAKIKAPISGYINKLFVSQGGMIGPSRPVCELVNIRELQMVVKVDERDLQHVRVKQEIIITIPAIDGKPSLIGRVKSISSKADFALQYSVTIAIDKNPDERLKPGMMAKAILTLDEGSEGVVIPRQALVGSIKMAKIYLLEGDICRLRDIEIGTQDGDHLKVTSGLGAGDMLIVSGQFNLRDGMKVKVIE